MAATKFLCDNLQQQIVESFFYLMMLLDVGGIRKPFTEYLASK